jgi:hypothetical protein
MGTYARSMHSSMPPLTFPGPPDLRRLPRRTGVMTLRAVGLVLAASATMPAAAMADGLPVVGIDGGRAGIASADGDTRFVTRKAGVNTRVLELGGPERATVVEDSRRARPLLEATHVGSSRSLRAPRGSRPRRGAARRRPLGRAERRPSSQSTGSGRPISRSTGAVDGNRDALAVHEHAEVDHPGRGLTTRAARRRLGKSKRRRPTLPGP